MPSRLKVVMVRVEEYEKKLEEVVWIDEYEKKLDSQRGGSYHI